MLASPLFIDEMSCKMGLSNINIYNNKCLFTTKEICFLYDWTTRMLLHNFKLPSENYNLILSDNILTIGESKYDIR